MPIYEYQCDACGERQEIMRKISDPPLKKCPLCGERKLRKLMSATAFRLKGGGWYETDFKDEKKRKNISKAEDAGGEKVEAKTEKAEAKPDKVEKTEADSKTDKTEKKTETATEKPKVEVKPKEKKKAKAKD